MLAYGHLLFLSAIDLFIVFTLRRHFLWEGAAGSGSLIHVLVS
jgi:hypothetical protein